LISVIHIIFRDKKALTSARASILYFQLIPFLIASPASDTPSWLYGTVVRSACTQRFYTPVNRIGIIEGIKLVTPSFQGAKGIFGFQEFAEFSI
jgi:hypothetical protein